MDGVEEVYGQHNAPIMQEGAISVKAGPMMAGSVEVDIDIKGQGGHGSEPALSCDPITAMAHIHVALHTIKARWLLNKDKAALVFGVAKSGTA